ncbi:hypothetical protein [Prosthecobacter sp.]|jgi:hypothetical protein|uniref:hypothetical protein n=1 Tax=Prosthecobacter sp. TaxID=1965333 RepID=UPI0037C9F34E
MKHKLIFAILAILICLIVWFLNSQLTYHDRLSQLASARKEVGMRPVDPSWRMVLHSNSQIDWLYSDERGGGLAKITNFHSSWPVWEEDYYHTGRSFRSADGDAIDFEQITVHYDFSSHLCAVRAITDRAEVESMISPELEEVGLPIDQALAVVRQILEKITPLSSK